MGAVQFGKVKSGPRRAFERGHEIRLHPVHIVARHLARHLRMRQIREGGRRNNFPRAIVERLNWLADTSGNGLRQSYAMMVNYRYKLGDVDDNHEAYANGRIVASREVRALAKG